MTSPETAVSMMLLAGLAAGMMPGRLDDEPPPEDIGQTWVEVDGEVYGAKPNELGPIGGGEGYASIVTEGDYTVSNVDELREALAQAQPGQAIFIPGGTEIDCTTLVFTEKLVLEIPEGVTLASDRGNGGSRGAVIYSDAFATRPLIRATGPNVRITGLWVRGPCPKRHLDHHSRSFRADRGDSAAQHEYYYKFPTSDGISTKFPGLEVDNCEVSGWSHGGVHLEDGDGHHVHHCYIHHNQYNGLGYGVVHGYGEKSQSLIEYNLFNWNRHSIAGTGKPGNAYEARHNVEIEHSLSHAFDMHGGRDRGDGTNIAGDWLKVHHNTFRCTGVTAIVIRGVSGGTTEIHHNWFLHPDPGGRDVRPWPTGGDTGIDCRQNAYGSEAVTVSE